jgi:hypothetical protein
MTASPRPTVASSDAPPFATAWAVLACVLAAMTLGYPALSGGFLVSPVSDQYIAGYPFREFAAASLRAGEEFPLWNPYLFGGMPYVAAMHGDIFYPTFLLRLVLPTDVAMTWGMILHLMLAGIAGYGFLRVIGVGFHAALVGGIAYMLGGQVASLVSPGHDGKLFVSALLPVTLIVLTSGIRDARQWAWGALALVVGLGVLSPHPQLLQYLLLASGAWALLLAFVGDGTTPAPARGVAVQRLAIALGAVVLGGAIGAIQYLPVREYVEWSPRTGGRDYEYATSFSMPIEELINTYLPEFSGILDTYWGRNGIHLHSEYIGTGVLFLMVLGFAARRAADRRALTWFWVGTGLVSLFWALGGNTPFYHLVYAVVPGSKFFRAPSTIFFVTTFAVSVLAAFGAERLLRGEVKVRTAAWGAGVGLAVVVLAYAGVFESIARSVSQYPQLEGNISANADAVASGALRAFLFLGATAGLGLLVHRKQLTPAIGGVLLAVVTITDLWSVQRLYWTFSPPAAQTYASDEAIVRMQQEKEPVRVITAGAAIGVPGAYHDPNLEGDGLMHHGVRVALGYHGNELGRYQQLGGKARGWDQIANPAFWGLMNVKYFYTTLDSLPISGARRVAGPVQSAAGSTVYLFELPGEHAYAWVVPTVAKYPDAEVAEAVRAPNFPYRSVALLDPISKTAAQPLTAIPEPLAMRAVVDSFAPGHARLTLDAPAPAGSALVVSENFYPGWTATIDGTPATVERANLSLMAVPLPEGARSIELTFDSAPYHTGKQVTIAAICLALVLMTAGFFIRPRGVAHG